MVYTNLLSFLGGWCALVFAYNRPADTAAQSMTAEQWLACRLGVFIANREMQRILLKDCNVKLCTESPQDAHISIENCWKSAEIGKKAILSTQKMHKPQPSAR